MKIVIVDDSAIIRGRLISMLSADNSVRIIGTTGIKEEAVNMIFERRPDLVILDLKLYNGSGICVLEKIKKELPEIKVAVLTNYAEQQFMDKCFELGADYFFDKSKEFEKIMDVTHC